MRVINGLFFLSVVLWTAPATAQDPSSDPAAPPPIPPIDAKPRPLPDEDAPIPPKVLNDDAQVDPTVEIRRDEDDNIVEYYKLEGRVYMVKVTPRNGIPYYYMDDDGDGELELREGDRAAYPVKPVYWKLKEW